MTQVNKIDSNVTGLRFSEEASIGVVAGSPVWIPLEPNSYSDFGGNVTTVARNPINSGRQRKKGVVTDLDASGGFEQDWTQTNLQTILQGFFFADFREKGSEVVTAVDVDTSNPDEYEVASTTGFLVGSLIKGSGFTNAANNAVNAVTAIVADTSVEVADGALVAEAGPPADATITVVGNKATTGDLAVVVSGDFPAISSSTLDFTTLGLVPGEWIYVGGDASNSTFFNAVNNGFKRVRSVAANLLTFDKSDSAMVTDDGTIDGAAGTGQQIELYFGRVLKNETGSSIVRRTYQLERTLGAPDDASPSQIQSEYLVGAVANELTINIPQADKMTASLGFIAIDHEQRTGATGVKSGTRPTLAESDAFNTSSDFGRIRIALVDTTTEAPTPLFAFLTELNLVINNNVSPNKAVATLGAFDVTAGTFAVSGSMTAYFSNVTAVSAVRNNSDVTLDYILAKDNVGIAVDLPLIALGEGRANVEQDQPITLPVSYDAATGSAVLSTMDHTLLMVFFDYLPTAAAA